MHDHQLKAVVQWLQDAEKVFATLSVVFENLGDSRRPLTEVQADQLRDVTRSFELSARELRALIATAPGDAVM